VNDLTYPTEKYKPIKTPGATLSAIYQNTNVNLCPITEEVIYQSDGTTPANTL
jgi:hypothetical protein